MVAIVNETNLEIGVSTTARFKINSEVSINFLVLAKTIVSASIKAFTNTEASIKIANFTQIVVFNSTMVLAKIEVFDQTMV